MNMSNVEFKDFNLWRKVCEDMGWVIVQLSSHPEDTYEHWFASERKLEIGIIEDVLNGAMDTSHAYFMYDGFRNIGDVDDDGYIHFYERVN